MSLQDSADFRDEGEEYSATHHIIRHITTHGEVNLIKPTLVFRQGHRQCQGQVRDGWRQVGSEVWRAVGHADEWPHR